MNDDFSEFMKQFFGPPNPGTWVAVSKLSGDDLLRKKNHDMQTRRLGSEARVLNDKLQVLIATIRANNSEFWDSLYRTYSLPSDLNYKIDQEGNITKHVPAPPAENA